MSDFLTRLAERGLGRATLVQPSLPSLFAPVAGPLTTNPAETTVIMETAGDTPGTAAPLPAHAPALRDTVSAAAPVSASDPQRQPAPRDEAAPPRATLIDGPATRVETRLVPSREARQSAAMTTPPLLTVITPRSPAPLQPPDDSRAENASPVAATRWSPLLPQRPPETAVLPSPAADNRAAPEPAVHITIGRVEVRANVATPPPAPRLRPQGQAGLSLGDYLKRGTGKP